jgi:hypothetical protein
LGIDGNRYRQEQSYENELDAHFAVPFLDELTTPRIYPIAAVYYVGAHYEAIFLMICWHGCARCIKLTARGFASGVDRSGPVWAAPPRVNAVACGCS